MTTGRINQVTVLSTVHSTLPATCYSKQCHRTKHRPMRKHDISRCEGVRCKRCSQSLRCVRWTDNPYECDHIQKCMQRQLPPSQMWTRSTESHLTILGTLSPSTQQPCKGNATNHRLLARKNTNTSTCCAPLQSWIMSLSGCAAVLRVSNQSVQGYVSMYTRPVKPRQSGRTILIRSAKQYISFHMPTLNTSAEAGCCCDAALGQTHYRSTRFKSIIMSSCRGINVTSDVRTLTHCMQHCMRKHTEHTQ